MPSTKSGNNADDAAVAGRRRRNLLLENLELAVGSTLFLALVAGALLAPLLQTANPMETDLAIRLAPIGSPAHPLGTDHLGRDIWSRVLEGARWSLSVAFLANLIAAAVGTTLGLLAAQHKGVTRMLVRQAVDIMLSFPGLVIAILVMVLVGRGFWPLVLTLALVSWPLFARVAFAEGSSALERGYVTAARLFHVPTARILLGHVLPALRPSLAVIFAFHFADLLIIESALSFLGLGAPLGVATWGNMLAEARKYLFIAPWLVVVPSLAIVAAVVAVNLLADAANSRLKARSLGDD